MVTDFSDLAASKRLFSANLSESKPDERGHLFVPRLCLGTPPSSRLCLGLSNEAEPQEKPIPG
jgi:hypothetical protein